MATRRKKNFTPRAWELDLLRGLSIIMVVWDHTMYDFFGIFGRAWKSSGISWLGNLTVFAKNYFDSGLRAFWWPVFVFIFFFISGICTTFSRNNFKRGIRLGAVALALTLFTYLLETFFFMEGTLIIFGVLHCLAVCILFYALIEMVTGLINKNKNRFVLPIVCLALATIIFVLDSIFNVPFNKAVAHSIVVDTDSFIAGFFVFAKPVWQMTADYFPLLPFIGFFMLGSGIAPLLYPKKQSLLPKLDGKWHYPLTIPGRYSLIVYLASQVLVIALLALFTYILTGSFV